MNHHYSDIRDRIKEIPKWWDENAVPRYCDFAPEATADIYAKECALVGIACQNCGTRFCVAFSWGDYVFGENEDGTSWVKVIEPMTRERVERLHYCDPPNAGCCAAGPTMNSEPQRVIEFWRREKIDWKRVPELECDLVPPWASPTEGAKP